jgi:Fe-S cluster assembly protein SufD
MTPVVASIPLPTRRDEAWRYAPHRVLADLTFGPPSSSTTIAVAPLLDGIPDLAGPRVVVVNGVVEHSLSRLDPGSGVTLGSLATSPHHGSAIAAGHADTGAATDAFVVLNIEQGIDGTVIEVPAGVTLDAPIHVIDLTVPDPDRNTSCSSVVVHLGAQSSATVVETRIGAGCDFGGSNVRTTVTLEHGATLDHIIIQDLPTTQVHLGRTDVVQDTGSSYRSWSFNLGAAYGRLAYEVRLEGPGALADLSGLYFGAGDQTLDQQITIVHAVENCTSRQSFRGVLDEHSVGVFNGGIVVRPGADGSDATQINANLLVSDRAEANTQPRLEILADEVTCTHGATVGQLDETALYYLRSRGIPAPEARQLLVNAFADQVVDNVTIDGVRDWITRRLGHNDDA